MPRPRITAIRFRPPVAIARLGDSDSPLEAFTWAEDTRLFGAGQTVIQPAVSLEVLPDGTVEPYLPGPIRFRDGLAIRPVCPFLELQADIEEDASKEEIPPITPNKANAGRVKSTVPLTSALLERAGLDLSQIQFQVVAANRKAQRRTGDASCSFEARLMLRADDHTRRDLMAWTHADGPDPLVRRQQPIWLGAFQVIRPVRRKDKYGVSLDTVRVRFTPGRGAVYGPPSAIEGQEAHSRRRYVIVPEANRILNPAASWCTYRNSLATYPGPAPWGTYDGESDLDLDAPYSVNGVSGDGSWGVVDDTCDAVIVATLSSTIQARARVVVGPPDFSPDRRPIVSFADDLADRDPESLQESAPFEQAPGKWLEAVTDLFRRIAETAPLIDVERARERNLSINQTAGPNGTPITNPEGFPKIDSASMTAEDRINGQPMMSIRFAALAAHDAGDGVSNAPLLTRSELAKSRHGELAVPEVMLEFIHRCPERFQAIVRPPFRRLSEPEPDGNNPLDLRDARLSRSYGYDARMPPFLRDGDFAPLSLTRHQWDLLFERRPDGSFSVRTELFELASREMRRRK